MILDPTYCPPPDTPVCPEANDPHLRWTGETFVPV
jgi:hypothetical protein